LQARVHKTRGLLTEVGRRSPPSHYLDYKDFLRSLQDEVAKEVGRYTYQQFSRDLGLEFDNAAYVVLHGLRRLNEQQAKKIVANLAIKGNERRYFFSLLEYTNCRDEQQREPLLQQLINIKSDSIDSDHERLFLRFFSEWYHSVIFEMIGLEAFQSDPKWIGERFHNRLTPDQVKRSLSLLESLNLIRFDQEKQRYLKAENTISAGEDVRGLATAGYHLRMLSQAQGAMSTVPHGEREFGAMTLAVDSQVLDRLKQDLQLFRKYAVFLSEQCEKPDRIVQLNFQMFSFTKQEGDSHE